MAEIKLSLEEYDALRARTHELQRQLNAAEAARDAALCADPTGLTQQLTQMILDVLPVAQFTVGNLDPRTVRGWPHAELHRFATTLKDLPGIPTLARETALEFIAFAYEARLIEESRAKRPEEYPAPQTEVIA